MSKVAIYSQYTEKRENGTTIFWKTGKGGMRHATFYCANSKRSLDTGDCTVIPENEVASWEPCADCCTDADVLEARKVAEAKRDALCPNKGVTMKHRIYSTCGDCGKEGKVTQGRLRAHKPATA